jgi:hypothetical protein
LALDHGEDDMGDEADEYHTGTVHGGNTLPLFGEKSRKRKMYKEDMSNSHLVYGTRVFANSEEPAQVNDSDEVIRLRLSRVRYNWEMLNQRTAAMDAVEFFIDRYGYCPFGPLGLVTTRRWQPEGGGGFAVQPTGCSDMETPRRLSDHHSNARLDLQSGRMSQAEGDSRDIKPTAEEASLYESILAQALNDIPDTLEVTEDDLKAYWVRWTTPRSLRDLFPSLPTELYEPFFGQ